MIFYELHAHRTKDDCYQALSEMEGFFMCSFLDYWRDPSNPILRIEKP